MTAEKYPSTLCWLFDLVHILAVRCNPRKLFERFGKVRSLVEESMEALTTNLARLATGQTGIRTDKKFTLDLALNPTICSVLEETSLLPEELKDATTDLSRREVKSRKLFRYMARMVENFAAERMPVEGRTCGYYLRGYCFLTMRGLLYQTMDSLLLSRKCREKLVPVRCGTVIIANERHECAARISGGWREPVRRGGGRRACELAADQGGVHGVPRGASEDLSSGCKVGGGMSG